MSLAEQVRVARRFLRSIRIDTDLGDHRALEGLYMLTDRCREILLAMARHLSETGQGAFTWTGPYGGGKIESCHGTVCPLECRRRRCEKEADKIFDWRTLPIRSETHYL